MGRRILTLRIFSLTAFALFAWSGSGTALAQFADQPKATVTAKGNAASIPAGQEAAVAIVVDVKKGFHAQSHHPKNSIPLSVKSNPLAAATWGQPIYPPGHDESYPDVGTLNVYTGRVVVYVPVKLAADAKPGDITFSGTAEYQICDDKGLCFVPETVPWSVSMKVVSAGEAMTPANAEFFRDYTPGRSTTTAPSTTSAIAQPTVVKSGGAADWGIMLALGAAFVAGILFNIVPCVLPVLPIKVLGFAEVAQHNRLKTISLSLVFGTGIVTVFAGLALFVLVFKTIAWGEQFSNPYFVWGIVILFIVLALWMFGALNVNLPAGAYAFTPRHDTYMGNYMWGILTAILSTPCTGPLFPPLLLWAQGRPANVGVPAMMMVGVGMAFPYVILSAFPEVARKFPRVGPWSALFKQMLAFLMIGSAVYFAAGRFVSGAALYWSLVPVALVAAIFIVARSVQLGAAARGIVIASVIGLLMLGATVAIAASYVSRVEWRTYSDELIEKSRAQDRIVLVKFTANWCLNCQYVERTVFQDKEVAARLDKYRVVPVKADLTARDAPGWGRLRSITPTGGIPLTAIYVPGRKEPIVIDSVYTSATLVQTLDQAAAR